VVVGVDSVEFQVALELDVTVGAFGLVEVSDGGCVGAIPESVVVVRSDHPGTARAHTHTVPGHEIQTHTLDPARTRPDPTANSSSPTKQAPP
jgi:hypothetical protein